MESINLLEVIELKNVLEDKFKSTLHIHDSCSGQYFSIDNLTPESKEYIINYFNNKNFNVIFTSKEDEFYLESSRLC